MGISSLTHRLLNLQRRKRHRVKMTRRRIEHFFKTESLEARMLLTLTPPMISYLHLVNDTGLTGDMVTTDPRVQGVLNVTDASGSDYRVEIDLNSDNVFERTLYVNPGVAFQFDPSAFLPYGNVTLTTRGVEYSFDEMDDVYGPSQTIRFNYQNPYPAATTNQAPTVSLANLPLVAIPENQNFAVDYKIADILIHDDVYGTNPISLGGVDAAKFKVVGNTLYLKAGTQLDFETAQVLQVSVDVDDPSIDAGVDASAVVLIAVGDVNEAPKLSLSSREKHHFRMPAFQPCKWL